MLLRIIIGVIRAVVAFALVEYLVESTILAFVSCLIVVLISGAACTGLGCCVVVVPIQTFAFVGGSIELGVLPARDTGIILIEIISVVRARITSVIHFKRSTLWTNCALISLNAVDHTSGTSLTA